MAAFQDRRLDRGQPIKPIKLLKNLRAQSQNHLVPPDPDPETHLEVKKHAIYASPIRLIRVGVVNKIIVVSQVTNLVPIGQRRESGK